MTEGNIACVGNGISSRVEKVLNIYIWCLCAPERLQIMPIVQLFQNPSFIKGPKEVNSATFTIPRFSETHRFSLFAYLLMLADTWQAVAVCSYKDRRLFCCFGVGGASEAPTRHTLPVTDPCIIPPPPAGTDRPGRGGEGCLVSAPRASNRAPRPGLLSGRLIALLN